MYADSWDNSDPDACFADEPWAAGEADEDDEGPQALDLRDQEEYETVPCPACGAAVSELAECCPHCGQWIVQRVRPSAGRRVAAGALALLLILLLLIWLL